MDETLFKSTTSDELRNVYAVSTNEPEPSSDEEDNETTYEAVNNSNQVKVCLVVSDQSIREKNWESKKTINKWTLTMLESCEQINVDMLRIRFDSVKKDKRERVYRLAEVRQLVTFLQNVLSHRPLSDMMIIYECVPCNLQFSQEKNLRMNGRSDRKVC